MLSPLSPRRIPLEQALPSDRTPETAVDVRGAGQGSPGRPSTRPTFDQIQESIRQASALLPIPGPISAFTFLNTLQALEDLPFHVGLEKGAEIYGCQPYLAEDRFREQLDKGRIRIEDLAAVVDEELGRRRADRIPPHGLLSQLRLAMLRHPVQRGPAAELRWFVAETDALWRMRPDVAPEARQRFLGETRQWVMRELNEPSGERIETPSSAVVPLVRSLMAEFPGGPPEWWSDETWESFSLRLLWTQCVEGVRTVPPPSASEPERGHREVLLFQTGEDSDLQVNELLIPFCAAFTDQGFSRWTLPNRERGIFRAFVELYRRPFGDPALWKSELQEELRRLHAAGCSPLESLSDSLRELGVDACGLDACLRKTLLALRGWAGMLHQMEIRPDRVPVPVPSGTLMEYAAIRLLVERFVLKDIVRRKVGKDVRLEQLLQTPVDGATRSVSAGRDEKRSFLVFQVAQLLGWTVGDLARMATSEWRDLLEEIESFSSLERRRHFHLAYERRFRHQTLDALALHPLPTSAEPARPRFQSVYCIDAREESFRRHLEEVSPDVETFSAAGFFGVAMYFRGAADAHFASSCPVVVKPQHWVTEEVAYSLQESHRQRAKARRTLGSTTRRLHLGSREMAGGALLTMSLGWLASIPLASRILAPRWTARIRKAAGRFVEPPPITRLCLERTAAAPGPRKDQIGFTVDEMAGMGERLLRDIGLTHHFARLVLFLGHGSACLNNPHKSVYDCGACTRAGGTNARAIAAILNDRRVRDVLASHGLCIPADTVFLGGLHDTCRDRITFSDLGLLPTSHIKDFEEARAILDEACERNAHERCRRFHLAPLTMSFREAKRHVERRAEDLSQTRPEYGNATNAICVVGRRSRTRGLFLDRRPFLMSYDPTQDDAERTILARILSGVVPVCEGINLQYLLSAVDPTGWGSGTKLPHNVASLLGVVNGASGDLLSGLPWQSVEIHEPLRCLFVVETTPEAMSSIMERNPALGRLLRNGWVTLAVLAPDSSEVHFYQGGDFVRYRPEVPSLPTAATSTDWYRGWRDHLGFAEIGRGARPHSSPLPARLATTHPETAIDVR